MEGRVYLGFAEPSFVVVHDTIDETTFGHFIGCGENLFQLEEFNEMEFEIYVNHLRLNFIVHFEIEGVKLLHVIGKIRV